MIASEWVRTEVVKELLRHPEIQVNTLKFGGETALTVAASERRHWVVKELLQAPGIQVNPVDMEGKTPLMLAAQWGHLEVLKILLQVPGIDVDRRSNKGYTALELAKARRATWASAEAGYDGIIATLEAFLDSRS